jgi:hypothetical protein
LDVSAPRKLNFPIAFEADPIGSSFDGEHAAQAVYDGTQRQIGTSEAKISCVLGSAAVNTTIGIQPL